MSDGSISFPKFVLPPLTEVSNSIYVANVPAELSSLPYASVLPAVLTPTSTLPILTVTLESGEEVSVPVHMTMKSGEAVNLTIRTLPTEDENGFAFKIVNSSVKVNISTPAPVMPSIQEGQETPQLVQPKNIAKAYIPQTTNEAKTEHFEKKSFTPIKMSAFVIKSIPGPLTNLLPELSEHSKTQAGMKLDVEVIPIDKNEYMASFESAEAEQNIQSGISKTENPVQNQNIQNPKDILQGTKPSQQQIQSNQIDWNTVKNVDSNMSPELKADIGPIKDDVYLMLKSLTPTGQEEKGEYNLPPRQTQQQTQSMRSEADYLFKTQTEQQLEQVKSPVKGNIPSPKTSVSVQSPIKPDNIPNQAQQSSVKNTMMFESQKTYQGLIYRPTEQCVPLIATKAGVVVIDSHIALPHLTPVQVVVKDIVSPLVNPDLPDIDMPTPFKNTWSVLTQALTIMEKADTFNAEGMKVILPQISPQLPSLMMNFIHASEQNLPFSAWFGQANVEILKSIPGGEAVLRRLEKDFSAGSKKAVDRQNTVWKGWDIPFLTGNIIEPVSLYLQRPNGGFDSENKGKARSAGVRFVIDLALSKLGKIQMEGLSNRPNKTFDLTIRYEKKLPDDFESQVQKIFTQTMTAFEYSGKMAVRQTEEFIEFLPEQPAVTSGMWA